MMDKEKHKIGNCEYYDTWVKGGQIRDKMFDSERLKICKDCLPNHKIWCDNCGNAHKSTVNCEELNNMDIQKQPKVKLENGEVREYGE